MQFQFHLKNFRSVLLVAATVTLIFFSCKKDNVIHGASPVRFIGSATVNAVPLNGGNVGGRWILVFEQLVSFRNDTLQGVDTSGLSGDIVTEFWSNGTMEIVDMTDTIPGIYSCSGNQLTFDTGSDPVTFSYGVSNNRMRWYYTETNVIGSDVVRTQVDYIFERY